MEFLITRYQPIRYQPIRFQSEAGLSGWLAANPTWREVARITVQKRFSGEVITLLAEYADVAQCAAAMREQASNARDDANTYQRIKRASRYVPELKGSDVV